MINLLLVGTGLTSAVTAALVRKKLQEKVRLTLWDKANGTGGRMSTSRCPLDPSCTADLGAQYVTFQSNVSEEHQELRNTLISHGLVEPLKGEIKGMRNTSSGGSHYVAPGGTSSIVKHFINEAAGTVHFRHQVTSVTEDNNKWLVETSAGVKGVFDIVVLTMPVPQILQLTGSIKQIIIDGAYDSQLRCVKYSSRYALGMFYKSHSWMEVPWVAKYIYDNDIFRYIAVDNLKRNRPQLPAAVVLHTTVSYGASNIERTIEDVQAELTQHAKHLFPDWPEPDFVKCQKWRYSQVVEPFPETNCLVLQEKPFLLAGGDGFTSSTVDGCVLSALSLADSIEQFVVKSCM